MKKFKKGDKVILLDKNAFGTADGLDKSSIYRRMCEKGLNHCYIVGYDTEYDWCVVSEEKNNLSGDFFLESDLEFYIDKRCLLSKELFVL